MSQSKVTVKSVSCPPFPPTRLLGIQVHENKRSKGQTPNVREREVAKTMDMSASAPFNCSRSHILRFTRSLSLSPDESGTADLVHAPCCSDQLNRLEGSLILIFWKTTGETLMPQSKVLVQSVSCPPFPRAKLPGIQVHEKQSSKASRLCQPPNVKEREAAKTIHLSASGPFNCSRSHTLHFTHSLWMKVSRQILCILLAPTESR